MERRMYGTNGKQLQGLQSEKKDDWEVEAGDAAAAGG